MVGNEFTLRKLQLAALSLELVIIVVNLLFTVLFSPISIGSLRFHERWFCSRALPGECMDGAC